MSDELYELTEKGLRIGRLLIRETVETLTGAEYLRLSLLERQMADIIIKAGYLDIREGVLSRTEKPLP